MAAMPNGDTITLDCIRLGTVEIALTDARLGIPDEIILKFFSPMFTTKAHGMGFGLVI